MLVPSLIAAKRRHKRGLLQRLMTGSLRLPEFASSGPWVTVPLSDLVAPVARPVQWADDALYRLVSIRRRNAGLFLREERRGASIKTKKLFTLRTGDFVLSRMQVVHGALAYVPAAFDGTQVSGMYLVLRAKAPERLRMEFLSYLSNLPAMYRKVLLSCHGVHIEKMTFDPKRFLQKTVTIPENLEEQDRITELLETADREISLLEKLLRRVEAQQRGLLQHVFAPEAVAAGDVVKGQGHLHG
jgi:type I restriction enzyme S subunit